MPETPTPSAVQLKMTQRPDITNGISLWLGDCLELMADIQDGSIDLILCDLPYGTTQNPWDAVIPFELLWEHYRRLIKPNGAIVLTASQPFTSALVMSNPKWFRYEWIWVKNKARGFLNANRQPLRNHESVLVFCEGQSPYIPQKTTGHRPANSYTKNTSDGGNYGQTKVGISGGGQTDRFPLTVQYFDVVNNEAVDKSHPTQKPVALFEYLIKTYTNENELVLDNCIGSGTTAVACFNTGRRCIGIEQDAAIYQNAVDRLFNVQPLLIAI